MTDDREPFREARAAGLQKRHEQRLENATYTAAEVKVLTEAALRLGRKEALDELRAWLYSHQRKRGVSVHHWSAYLTVAGEITRMLAPDAASAQTDPSGYSDLPQDSQAGRSPLSEQDAVHEDLRQILLALGLGDQARPYSSHEVVQREVLPAIRRLVPTADPS